MSDEAAILLELLDDSEEVGAMMVAMHGCQRKVASAPTPALALLTALEQLDSVVSDYDNEEEENTRVEEEEEEEEIHATKLAKKRNYYRRRQRELGKPEGRKQPGLAKLKGLVVERKQKVKEIKELPDSEFFNLLHVTKNTFVFLLSIIDRHINATYRSTLPQLDSSSVLIATLRYLRGGCTYSTIAKDLLTSRSNVHQNIHGTVAILCHLASDYIYWPKGERVLQVESGFHIMTGLNGAVGVVGDCQIVIKAPALEASQYINKEKRAVIHLLGICDSNSAFTYVNAGQPGALEDYEVLASSSLYQVMEEEPLSLFSSPDHYIVGNANYPTSPFLRVPSGSQWILSSINLGVNQQLIQAQTAITKAFQQLKTRFGRLNFVEGKLDYIPNLIKACCVLHNIARMFPEEEAALEASLVCDNNITLNWDTLEQIFVVE